MIDRRRFLVRVFVAPFALKPLASAVPVGLHGIVGAGTSGTLMGVISLHPATWEFWRNRVEVMTDEARRAALQMAFDQCRDGGVRYGRG